MKEIGVGVVGCGFVGRGAHAPAFHAMDGARLVAVADPDSRRRNRAVQKYEVPANYHDYHDLLRDTDVDAVVIFEYGLRDVVQESRLSRSGWSDDQTALTLAQRRHHIDHPRALVLQRRVVDFHVEPHGGVEHLLWRFQSDKAASA